MGDDSMPLVKAIDMAKKYGDFIALHPLNVEVHAGEFFGVFGPNGAGKTSLMRAIAGRLKLDSGSVTVGGADPLILALSCVLVMLDQC